MITTLRRNAIALALTVATCASAPYAMAATMFFSPDSNSSTGSIDVILPIDKLSSVPVPRGRISINGNIVELSMIREWQFDREIVLYGNVLDTRVDTSGKQPIVRGVAFFINGPWMEYFDDHRQDEVVVTAAGERTGRVTDVTNSDLGLELGTLTERVPLSAVSEIRSPRVFSFAIPTTPLQPRTDGQPYYSDARTITMTATAKPFRLASLRQTINRQMDDGDLSTRQLIGIGTALSIVELAQLLPVMIVPLAAGPPYSRQLRTRTFAAAAAAKAMP